MFNQKNNSNIGAIETSLKKTETSLRGKSEPPKKNINFIMEKSLPTGDKRYQMTTYVCNTWTGKPNWFLNYEETAFVTHNQSRYVVYMQRYVESTLKSP